MGIEIEYPLGYAGSGGIVYFVTPASDVEDKCSAKGQYMAALVDAHFNGNMCLQTTKTLSKRFEFYHVGQV